MSTEEITEQVRYLVQTEPDRAWKINEIADILGCRGHKAKALKGVLDDLVADGGLVQVRNGIYTLGKNADLLTGVLQLVRSGAGYVTDKATGESLRIAPEDVGTALPGDTVTVRRMRGRGQEPDTGRIIKVAEKGGRVVVGTFTSAGRVNYVVPIDPVYRHDIVVPDPRGAKENDRVVVRVVEWANAHVAPEGEIIEVIGPADRPSLDTEVVCRQYELPGDFPEEVVRAAGDVSARLDDREDRLDLTGEYILTVDPATARDFDDAISFSRNPDGTRVLGVHIADVSHYVTPGSPLDEEAAERGTSVYLVDKVIPMLPEQLSNGVCSLRPDEDRLTFSVFLTYDEAGRVVARRFARSVIRSKLRLDYGQALAILEGRAPEGLAEVPPQAAATLRGCADLALQLRSIRMRSGALDLDVPESEILLDEEKRMTGIAVREYDVSHQMIEECMVAANEAVATELSTHGVRILSRLHEPPDPLKIDDLTSELQQIGFRTGNLSIPKNLTHFLETIANHPLRELAHTLVLRSMKRACYSADAMGHFGLAKHYYSHFTSPIRRYPDLILHRQLAEYLTRRTRNAETTIPYLKRMAQQCSDREQRADEAERTLVEIKKYRFLQQQIEDGNVAEYDAVISRVTNFGLFVEVSAIQVGGLIHISTISDQFVRYDHAAETLSADGVQYCVGGHVRVFVARVDFTQRHIDFALVRETPAKAAKPKKGKAAKTAKAQAAAAARRGEAPRAPAKGKAGFRPAPPKKGRSDFGKKFSSPHGKPAAKFRGKRKGKK